MYFIENEQLGKLMEQLESNTKAADRVEERIYNVKMCNWHYGFYSDEKRMELIEWNQKVLKRVHRLRFRILENLSAEISKEKQRSSSASRELAAA